MTDELLERATRALRERNDVASSSDGEIGMRRLESALTPSVHRRRFGALALIAAASLSGVTAWAGISGRLPALFRALSRDHVATAVSGESGPRAAAHVPARAPDEEALPPAPPPPMELEPPAPSSPAAPAMPADRRRATANRVLVPSSVVPPPTAVPPEPAPDADALYREAHNAHFVRRDPVAALAAWDRYLAAAGPNARMSLEARYNRAIALVRLGRTDEARKALEPFARGEYGGYRREDAARLLESLR